MTPKGSFSMSHSIDDQPGGAVDQAVEYRGLSPVAGGTPIAPAIRLPDGYRAPINAAAGTIAFAAKHGVELSTVTGTGPGRRITRNDVEAAIAAAAPAPVINTATAPVVAALDLTWWDIAGGCMVPTRTRSDCGCAVWEHLRGTGFQALLHDGPGHCALGRDDAELSGNAIPRWRLAAGLHGCETEDEARAVVEAQAREEARRATAYAAALPPPPPPRLDLYPGGGETVDGSATLAVVPPDGGEEPWVETMTEDAIWAAATLNPLSPDGRHFTRPEPTEPQPEQVAEATAEPEPTAAARRIVTPEDAVNALPELRRALRAAEALAARDTAVEVPASIRSYALHDAIWTMTPALKRIKADADRRGISPWALLGSVLARAAAAIPANVRLVPESGEPGGDGEGANLDIFTVISGPPGSGKSSTLQAASAMVLVACPRIATFTGEGLNGALLKQQNGNDAIMPAMLVEIGEGQEFIKECGRLGSHTLAIARGHWGGDVTGKWTNDKDRRSTVDALWARVALSVVLHPEHCTELVMAVGDGSSARFIWLPAYRTGDARPAETAMLPFQLPVYRDVVAGEGAAFATTSPIVRPKPYWIRQPAAMRAELDAVGVKTFIDPVAVTETDGDDARRQHDVLQRFKMSAVLAALDGETQPGDAHWHAATEAVEVSHLVQAALLQAVAGVAETIADCKGQTLALTDLARNAHRDQLIATDTFEAQAMVISALTEGPLLRNELRERVRSVSRAAARGYTAGLNALISDDSRIVIDDGRGLPLRLAAAAAP
jgi:hypothetical protein